VTSTFSNAIAALYKLSHFPAANAALGWDEEVLAEEANRR
jgi:hypothetical protein